MLMKLNPPIEKGSNVEHEIENESTIDVNEIGPPPPIEKGSNVEHEIETKAKLMLMKLGPPD